MLGEDRVADELDTNSMRSGTFIEMYRYRLRDLLLQIPQVLPLRCDATRPIGVIPPRHEPSGLLVTLDLKRDFFHNRVLIIPCHCYAYP
jgi:hypothetical protein